MKTILHRASTRGHADHGWLDSWHTFSFAHYHDPARIHFGALRVLNDDTVAPGMGFGKHPHDNMEIVSIPLEGALKHRDSMGSEGVIKYGDIQTMTAGSGLQHSEMNGSHTEPVKFLQIWVFPKLRNVPPRYADKTFDLAEREGKWQLLVSPDGEAGSMVVNQDTWFSIGKYKAGEKVSYTLKSKDNGLYAFLIQGSAKLGEELLERRDGVGITDTDSIAFEVRSDAEILLMEVPMFA
jgi:redox-sensitive bicupin YhaK (pirin superfamily)